MYARLSSKTARREEKWTLPRCIIVEFEQRNCEEFHVFGNSKNFCGGKKPCGYASWCEGRDRDRDVLRSGICTRKSFLHSLGLVMSAGTNGYYAPVRERERSMTIGS